jgi:hypothetical protein
MELCADRRYETTKHFIGLIWCGYAVIGIDAAPWGWGLVVGPCWAGWYWTKKKR